MEDKTTILFTGKSNKAPFQEVNVEWHNIINNDVPSIEWTQIHAIVNYNGKVLVVSKTTDGDTMIHVPGGHIEGDEDLETALRREILEETGGTMVSWKPLGYQKRTDGKGKVTHQVRAYAEVKDVKSEIVDVDGLISYTKSVDVSEMLEVLGWNNPIGSRIFELVADEFNKKNTWH